ncbi:MAG: Hpt domain-containing protein [Caldilineaceae bacterium]|nr:Hpt domain-containing protein [Caldilineaceae bacterium]
MDIQKGPGMAGANLQHPINMVTLRDLEDTVAIGIPEIMLDLINTFTVDSRQTFDNLKRALDSNDARLVEINAHALKSSSATFGAEHLSAIFAWMELAARDAQLDEIRCKIDDVIQKLTEVEDALNAERERLK